MKQRYLTTPLYYVNDKPHLGHAYCSILVDTFNRFYKIFGYETKMLTGVDEHGQKVMEAASKNNLKPIDHCNTQVPNFTKLLEACKVKNDIFYRTTDKSHIEKVQKILTDLFNRGDIYLDKYTGNYCTPCETFYTEKDLVDGKCPMCGRETTVVEEENYFFDMPKYQEKLMAHIENNPDFIQPKYRRNEVLGILKKGLRPLCISRKKEKMSWGIEIPFDKEFVTYVWFDALTNYINGIGYLENEEEFNKLWDTSVNFVGKDILLHHTIYWPTMLMAMGLNPPKNILIHGWWLSEGEKMSKSKGNTIEPLDIIEKYGSSSFRFFLLREMSIGNDGNYTQKAFIERHNNELLNDFGNLVNRAVHFTVSNFSGIIPEPVKKTDFCDELEKKLNRSSEVIEKLLFDFEMNKLLDEVMLLVRTTNKYIEDTAPWKLIKTDKELCGSVLYRALESVRICSIYLSAVIPETIEILDKAFIEGKDLNLSYGNLKSGTKISKPELLFTKIELTQELDQKKIESKNDNTISIDDFNKVEIKTGKILECKKADDSDRLLILKIDLGNKDIRQIVSGIAKSYDDPSVLVNKLVLVASNLAPAVIRGIESNGMLLSVKTGKNLKVVELEQEFPIGKKLV
ncbi:MAG: methionine--tRNA ligase [Candidatus Delongbacteria bacterium]|nr:methionine--tRNA ligase [Candidatus Delongbacteria bacterium]MBN2836960.1 methionine--tRNA ligase [Candidatus Delongbacteria bacterium]